jgi:hypothetical protein
MSPWWNLDKLRLFMVFFLYSLYKKNIIGGVMVNVLVSIAVDRGFEPQ